MEHMRPAAQHFVEPFQNIVEPILIAQGFTLTSSEKVDEESAGDNYLMRYEKEEGKERPSRIIIDTIEGSSTIGSLVVVFYQIRVYVKGTNLRYMYPKEQGDCQDSRLSEIDLYEKRGWIYNLEPYLWQELEEIAELLRTYFAENA